MYHVQLKYRNFSQDRCRPSKQTVSVACFVIFAFHPLVGREAARMIFVDRTSQVFSWTVSVAGQSPGTATTISCHHRPSGRRGLAASVQSERKIFVEFAPETVTSLEHHQLCPLRRRLYHLLSTTRHCNTPSPALVPLLTRSGRRPKLRGVKQNLV